MRSAAQPRTTTQSRKLMKSSAPTVQQLAAADELAQWQYNIRQQKQSIPSTAELIIPVQPKHIQYNVRESILCELYPKLYNITNIQPINNEVVQEHKEQVINKVKKRNSKTNGTTTIDPVQLPAIPSAPLTPHQPMIEPLNTQSLPSVEYIKLPPIIQSSIDQLHSYGETIDYTQQLRHQHASLYPTFNRPLHKQSAAAVEQPPLRFIDEQNYRARIVTKEPIVCSHNIIKFDNAWQCNDVFTQRITITNNNRHSVKFHCKLQDNNTILTCHMVKQLHNTITAAGMQCHFDVMFCPTDLRDHYNTITFTASHSTTTRQSARHTLNLPVECVRTKPILQYSHCNDHAITLGSVMHLQPSVVLKSRLYNNSDVDVTVSLYLTESVNWLRILHQQPIHIHAHSSELVEFDVDTTHMQLDSCSPIGRLSTQLNTMLDNHDILQHTLNVTVSCHALSVSAIDSLPISSSSNSIDYGVVTVYDTHSHTITMTNNSLFQCSYHTILTNGAIYSVSMPAGVIEPQCSVIVDVCCYSTVPGSCLDQLQIINTDNNHVIGTYTLHTQFMLPAVYVQPSNIICDSIYVNQSQQYDISVMNDSNVECSYRFDDIITDTHSILVIPSTIQLAPNTSITAKLIVQVTQQTAAQSLIVHCDVHPLHDITLTQQLNVPVLLSNVQQPELVVDQHIIDYNTVPIGVDCTKKLIIYNPSTQKIQCSVTCSDARVDVNYKDYTIEPDSNTTIDVRLHSDVCGVIDVWISIQSSLQLIQIAVHANVQQPVIRVENNLSDVTLTLYQSQLSPVYTAQLYNDSDIDAGINLSILSKDVDTASIHTDRVRLLTGTDTITLCARQHTTVQYQLLCDVVATYTTSIAITVVHSTQLCSIYIPTIHVVPVNLICSTHGIYQSCKLHEPFTAQFSISNPTLQPIKYTTQLLNTNKLCIITLNHTHAIIHPSQQLIVELSGVSECPSVYNQLLCIAYTDDNNLMKRHIVPITIECTDSHPLVLQSNLTLGLSNNILVLTKQPTLQRLHIANNTAADILYTPYVYDYHCAYTHHIIAMQCDVDSDSNVMMTLRLHDRKCVDIDYPIQIDSHHITIPAYGTGIVDVVRHGVIPDNVTALIHGYIYMMMDETNQWYPADSTFGMQQLDVIVKSLG